MGLFNFFRKNATTETSTSSAPHNSSTVSSASSQPATPSQSSFSPIFDSSFAQKCKYRYKDVKFIKCDNAHPKFCKGSLVGLINNGSLSQPDIHAVLFDDSALGYKVIGILFPSRLDQMIADWLDRSWFIGAQISDISDSCVYLDIIMGEFEAL
ncbi:MAG: hypothetical protein IJ418_00540 [Clostridia bacterium]|nr:hypothetical protein [Clostridia bacterium]